MPALRGGAHHKQRHTQEAATAATLGLAEDACKQQRPSAAALGRSARGGGASRGASDGGPRRRFAVAAWAKRRQHNRREAAAAAPWRRQLLGGGRVGAPTPLVGPNRWPVGLANGPNQAQPSRSGPPACNNSARPSLFNTKLHKDPISSIYLHI